MYFIGQTRFSIFQPESKAWNVSQMSEKEYISHLFSDTRIKSRMNIFIKKSIPILKEMADNFDYRHIISFSSHLPSKWKDVLYSVQKENPFLFLHEVDQSTVNPIIELLKEKKNGSVAYFRLDDDDLVSFDYMAQLSKYNKKDFRNMAVSFGRGYAAYYHNDVFSDFRELRKPLLAIGLAYIGYWENKNLDLPLNYSHHNLDRYIPVIIDSKLPSFLWTHHNNQDSAKRIGAKSAKEDLMKMNMVNDFDQLRDRFPQLIEDICNVIESRKTIFSIERKVLLNDTNIVFEINTASENERIECTYDFELIDTSRNVPNAALICFGFEGKAEIQGLTLSENTDIGWYKYVSFVNGKAKGLFSFDVEKGKSPITLKILKWAPSLEDMSIKNISLIN